MRLAIVRQRYNPFGGAERFVARALPALERAGAEVTLITRSAVGWDARRALEDDPFHIGRVWRDWSFARAARAAWRRGSFELVQSHERIAGCDVYRAGDGVHRRWLELRRQDGGALERLAIALNPYHRYVCRAEKEMFEHPRLRAVVCNSRMVGEEIRRAFRISPEKLHVVYSGVDLAHFTPALRAELRDKARAELGCRPRDVLFLFVGSGFARKGLDSAIDALAMTKRPSYRLAVIGTDRRAARYADRARSAGVAEHVRFLGGRQDVRPYYAAADCFVLPSRYDPFPNTALEALAMGLPILVSSRCGAAEVVERGVNGWVCEANDAARLASTMREAGDAIEHADMTAAARASAERFGIDAMGANLAALYRQLMSA
jgi:UDP-glucose:(heptosyl)LPS alpha-1,3-glucosyltransferase